MIKKERYISNTDYELLKKLYPNNMDEIIKKINNDYPIQYLIGDVDFYGYTIKVDERALIPRFETEELVENTIKYIKQNLNENVSIIDLGTGSGAIGLTLKQELPNSQVTLLDISKDAIKVAVDDTTFSILLLFEKSKIPEIILARIIPKIVQIITILSTYL